MHLQFVWTAPCETQCPRETNLIKFEVYFSDILNEKMFQQVPHSQCLLKENPKFFRNFRSKNSTLKANFWPNFLFNICHYNQGLAFKSKNYFIAAQNCMYFIGENSQKLRQKRKWALWMRHQSSTKSSTGYPLKSLQSLHWC